MTRPQVDRRAARTRTALGRALVSLVRARGYEAATVADVCAAAEVGRSTFYAHYAGKDDLKRRGMLEHLRGVLAERAGEDGAGDVLSFALPLFEHARDNLDLYRALARGPGRQLALEALHGLVREVVRAEMAEMQPEQARPVPREAVAQFVAGAWLSVLTWWLDGGARLSPREVAAIFRKLATQGVALDVRSS